MGIVVAVGLFFMICIVFLAVIYGKKGRLNLESIPTPTNLGIQLESLTPIIKELNHALPNSYKENVKQRFLTEHPKWTDNEFEWSFFELQRFFVMNQLLKSVPMFSQPVDEVWHEMLMFTRDYDQFSKRFYKETLHHAPNMKSEPIPGKRGFFDWIYLHLFKSNPNSRRLWGGFLNFAIDPDILGDFKNLSEEELLEKYFRNNGEWVEVKMELIRRMKGNIESAVQFGVGEGPKKIPLSLESTVYQTALIPAVYFSIVNTDRFQEKMGQVMPADVYGARNAGVGSACSGFAGDGGGKQNFGGDSDGGGDTGSSCGAGCSS